MSEKISIVMPCYRAERYIEDTLRDILAQTYTNWELICVSNGAGQEAQLEILERYSRIGGGKILVLTEEKGDRCRARNIGMAAATGEWITFSDQDDRIEPDHLQKYIDKATEREVDIVMGGWRLIRVKEEVTIDQPIKGDNLTFAEIVKAGDMTLNTVWSKLFRASFLKKIGLQFHEDLGYWEDSIFVKEALVSCPRVSTIEMGGYQWMCRDENSGSSTYKHDFWEAFQIDRSLRVRLWTMGGCTEAEVKHRLADFDFIQGYFFVCNLFKQGSTLSFRERRKEIRRLVFDNADMRAAIAAQDRKLHNPFIKIYDFAYDTGSSWWMTVIFQLQYWLKYHLRPLYFKVLPWLRG